MIELRHTSRRFRLTISSATITLLEITPRGTAVVTTVSPSWRLGDLLRVRNLSLTDFQLDTH